ncbi:MAG TPA: phage replisome organizer N-terminal domain-containing protein [Anaerolineae bacterium]|nr:phage replisome organizer N-terminal domain-containing protein [Anaerolineae bacterium]
MAYPWFRAYSEMLHDPKIKRMTPEQRWVWVGLLCLASDSDERGVIELAPGVAYELDDFEAALDVDVATIDACLQKAVQLNMIKYDGTKLIIVNWERRQYDNPSDVPERTRARQRKHREATRDAEACHERAAGSVTSASRDVTTQTRLDTESDRDTDTDNTSNRGAADAALGSVPPGGPDSVSMDAFDPDISTEGESPELEDAIRRWSGALHDGAAVESNLTQIFAIWSGYPQIRASDMIRLVNETGTMVQGMRGINRPMAYFFRSIRGHLERELGPPRATGRAVRVPEAPQRGTGFVHVGALGGRI